MRYLPLFSLQLKHAYYNNSLCPDFHIEPSVDTAKVIKNHRCVLKRFLNGIQMFYPVTGAGHPFVSFDDDLIFKFCLYLKNTNFPLFTDLVELNQLASPYYSNDVPNGDPPNLGLDSNETIAVDRRAFSYAELHYNSDWLTNLEETPQFGISFLAKRVWWHFYLVTNESDAEFTLTDNVANAIPLKATKITSGSDYENLIPIQQLINEYPDSTLWVFESNERIVIQDAVKRSLKLQISYAGSRLRTIMSHVPNPSFKNFILINGPDSEYSSEIEVNYQILKYFSQPIPATGD